MPIPEFIVDIRRKIGQDELWLPGVTGVVRDDDGRILLVRRSDNLRWTLITGCLDPGEQPGVGLAREVLEETGVVVAVERVLAVQATNRVVHANGDRAVYLDVAFVCRAVGGRARVNDDESVEVGWFTVAEVEGMGLPPRHVECVRKYLDGAEAAWFEAPGVGRDRVDPAAG